MTSPESTSKQPEAAAPEAHKGNAAEDFARSIAYSAFQEPVSGITQIADGLFHTNLLPNVQFINAPEKAQFGTLDYHAQQVGSAIGMLVPFLLVNKGSKALLGGEAAADAGLLSRSTALNMTVKQAALSGFAYDAFLRPSDYQQGNTLSFLESRGFNGLTGAASFTALSLSSIGLSKMADSAMLKDTFAAPILRSSIGSGILSGLPAGTVASEMNAWRQEKLLPTASDWGQTMYGYSLIGGFMGAAHTINSNATVRSGVEDLTSKVRARMNDMKSSVQSSSTGWLRPAFATGYGAGVNDSVEPGRTDVTRPLAETVATSMKASNGKGDAPDAVQARTQEFRDLERVINRGQDHQDYVHNQLRSTLSSLQRQGLVSTDWEVYPTKAGSPADKIGADYVLLNTHTRELHILDATANDDKVADPRNHNVAAIRRDGLIYYEKPWFDEIGALRTDPSEDADIRTGVQHFQEDLRDQLLTLTHQQSLLKLGEVEFPDIMPVEPAKAQEQITRFVQSLRKLATKSDGPDQTMLNDFANTVEKKAGAHLDITMRTVASPEFQNRIGKTADKVFLARAVDQVLRRPDSESHADKTRSDVSYHKKTNTINFEEDGVIYTSGDMQNILAQSRGRMINRDTIADSLNKTQWKDLQAAYPGMSDAKISDMLSNRITAMANDVTTGGARGSGRPVIFDEIVTRLKGSDGNALLSRPVPPKVKVESGPKISDAFRSAASEFASKWHEEGFEAPPRGEKLDPDSVALVFSELIDGSANPAPYQDLLDKYEAGDPAATVAIESAFNQASKRPAPPEPSDSSPRPK